MTTPRHSVSVAAAVIDSAGRALVVQRRDNGRWEPPGGVLELGETLTEGVRRETLEETGLTVDVGPLTGVYKNMVRGVVALVFRCHRTAGELTPNDEAVDFRWLTRDEIASMLAEVYAIRLTDALNYDTGPTIRSHDGVRLVDECPGTPGPTLR